ncbi:NAD-dependent epimerase/dehydratase family protein [Agromyces sp. SYSU K20354]|uniref:NAD-dependent epimerase/dehydratase family protein n=1 Tax=Agromyces cavernae TaxID=2898659 RepID=UPI001E6371A3|nr:NAD-dependent epimerase/dehydratase family protein [Agromyces cavernae]MCD2441281.1 NAD-dependent epimerase/dehydratase family protein [Agromyces cavernae]
MDLLILGGTQWLGRELAKEASARGHRVTCLARGEAGAIADGAVLVRADRSQPGAYDEVARHEWDAVIDVTRQPGFARRAAVDLGPHAAHWTFISSGNVYAAHDEPGADESAELMAPLEADESTPDTYGEAKSAIELAYREALGDRLLVIRPGLIAGPGDASGRSGYWVARAARDDQPILVPDILDAAVQAIHIDDLVRFTLDSIEQRRTGAFNAVGDRTTFGDWLARSRTIAGHRGEVIAAAPSWLAGQGVAEWSGPDSLPLWIIDPEWSAFLDRSNAAAVAAGLSLRPIDELLAETLEWERAQGLDRERGAGLDAARERALLAALLG